MWHVLTSGTWLDTPGMSRSAVRMLSWALTWSLWSDTGTQGCRMRLRFHFVQKMKKTCRAGLRAVFTQSQHSREWGTVFTGSAHISGFLVTTEISGRRLSCSIFRPQGELSLQPFMFPYKECHEFCHSPLLAGKRTAVKSCLESNLHPCSLDHLENLHLSLASLNGQPLLWSAGPKSAPKCGRSALKIPRGPPIMVTFS